LGNTERFVSALLGSPFGLNGRVKIESLSGEENHLLELKKITLRKGQVEKEYKVEEVFSSPLSLKLAGIDSPEAAKALKGAEILIPREQAAPLKEGELYIEDLRGLEVIAEGGKNSEGKKEDKIKGTIVVGTINDVIEGGGGFLAEILLPSGEKKLVPFRNEFFGKVDLAGGRAELLHTWILA